MRALIFDLDGTLVDTVYAHIFAWQKAFGEAGMEIDGWRIHRRIGMSGGLFTCAVARELDRALTPEEAETLQSRHGEVYRESLPRPPPLPGAAELLAFLRESGIVHCIATSGRRLEIDASLVALGVGDDTVVIERGEVARAKPEPDLFQYSDPDFLKRGRTLTRKPPHDGVATRKLCPSDVLREATHRFGGSSLRRLRRLFLRGATCLSGAVS